MSFNQARYQKSEAAQDRRTGRSASFNQQRSSSGGYSKGGGAPAPPPSLSTNRSFKKSNNAQGGQSRVNVRPPNIPSEPAVGAPPTQHNLQNGAHVQPQPQPQPQPQSQGQSDAGHTSATAKPAETPPASNRSTRALPKAPTSQPPAMSSSEMPPPSTPQKAPGDASKGFSFQFGSLSPGLMNGMQIPARTSSAPPNLDEQKRDQVRHDAIKTGPPVPVPPAPKHPLPKRDMSASDHSIAGDSHTVSKGKKDQVPPIPPSVQSQKPSAHAISGIPIQMPFNQPQVPIQFSGPNTSIQSQGMASASLQMPIPVPMLPVGSAPPMQQQMFVAGLQPHMMQPQGIMHQGQGLNFGAQMNSQFSPPLGTLGMSIGPYSQQQGAKFGGGLRKTPVKITHPETHQEVRLDKRTEGFSDGVPSSRSHPNVSPQAQHISSYPPNHPVNYYTNSFGGPVYYAGPSTHPLSGTQMTPTSQASRFNPSVNQGAQRMTLTNSQDNSQLPERTGISIRAAVEPPKQDQMQNSLAPPSALAQGTSKPKIGSDGENNTGLSSANLLPAFDKVESPNAVNVSANSASRNSEVPRGPLSKEPGSQLGALPGPNKQYVGSTGASGEHSVTSSSTGNRSSTEAALTNVAGSQLGALPGPNKQHVGSTGSSGEQSVTSSSTANHSSTEAALTNVAGRRMENLSRSNSIKNHEQGKKGDDPHPIKVDEEGNSISAVALQESSLSGVLENLEAKTTDTCPSGICEDVPESVSELLSTTDALSPDILELKCNGVGEGIVSVSSEISAGVPVLDNSQSSQQSIQDDSAEKNEILDNTDADRGELESTGPVVEQPKESDSSVVSSVSVSLEHSDIIRGGDQDSAPLVEASGKEVPTSTTERTGLDEERYDRGIDKANLEMPTSSSVDFKTGEATPCDAVPLASVHGDNSYADASLNGRDEVIDSSSVSMSESLKAGAEDDGDVTESLEDSLKSVQTAVPKDKPAPEISRASSHLARGKKKRKEFLLKADAAGPTLDLYMAYKGSEERKEAFKSSKGTEIPSEDIHDNQAAAETSPKEAVVSDDVEQIKAEIDDWEDAADVSSPALEPSTSGQQVDVFVPSRENRNGFVGRKYSRDFLLKFAERCTNLPENFEVTHDIAEAFNPSVNVSRFADRDSHPSPGRTIDRQSGGARLERRGSGLVDDDRWNKLPGAGPFGGPGRDLRLDVGLGSNLGLRSGQGGNYGVLRNPRAQTPVQYAGGILSGPMQSPGFQGGMQRNNSDADRWQRGTGFHQKGLMPSPQTPLQVMHRAENKYEVGKVQDGEEGKKQRQLKAILNKLTPQNFQKLFEQVKAVNIDNATTLRGLISQIFDKALMEPTFCEMYADLCSHLAQELPDFTEDENRITFKRVLLNKCQEEFERGEREEEEANKAEEEGEIKQSEGEREEKRINARRRMLGNIRLIGELYKKKMLTEKIMHECIKKLLGGQQETPDEEDLEALCKLMSTIGAMIDHAKAKDHMDAYFDRMGILSNNMNLSSRVRFMLKDLIDLRKNKWQQRRKVEGPKKIDEVHRDAAQERHAQVGRNSRGSGINSSRSRQPVDFSSRGSSMLSSPNAQVSGFRALQSQVRGPGSQDVRFEERQPHEPRPLAVPLSQRLGDDSHSITLGPQGGLGRGMSYRGSSSMSSTSVADISSSLMDSRRIADGSNGFSSVEKTSHGSRETGTSSMADRLSGSGAYDQTGVHRNRPGSREGFDRSGGNSPSLRVQGTSFSQDISSEKVWPDEKLRDMSIAAIKEFYSAKDEKEISLCIKDLNSPRFYPTMISLWVTDSFERKDSERDLLAKLLISLTTEPQECILSEDDLKKGFESVLTTLEDSVNDAPKAAEYVGRIFGQVIAETMISLKEIGQLIQKGGEEPGQLLKVGLAADVLGSTLEVIKSEKGETDFNEIRSKSNLRLEDFRLPGTRSSRILDKFI